MTEELYDKLCDEFDKLVYPAPVMGSMYNRAAFDKVLEAHGVTYVQWIDKICEEIERKSSPLVGGIRNLS